MPTLSVQKKLQARSERVKCVDLHPVENWMLASLYNGQIHIWDYERQQLIKTFEASELPVRAAKFISKKNWIVCCSDDMQMRIYNYNTSEKQSTIDAHSDYIRSVVVHPAQPYLLTSSDDMTIKLWNWEKNFHSPQVFEEHSHYVMQVVFNPKDSNTFASASLDRTVKVWRLGSHKADFTLEGHERGVNCVDYCHSGDKPYLISGADDHKIRIWDYQTKTCVQELEGHSQNLSAVLYHPELPIIITGSEDGSVKIWHMNTYRSEAPLNYGLERVWTIACLKRSNTIAIGCDNGSVVLKLGNEEPAMSMDSFGKIVFARHSELHQANIKLLGNEEEIKDGVPLPLQTKDIRTCEIFPQTISHNPNGRFVVVCGDGEFIILTALTLKTTKDYGTALEFVWASDSSIYAIRENINTIKIFKTSTVSNKFKLHGEFDSDRYSGIYGGSMLGVKTEAGLSFYEWNTLKLIRRIEIEPKDVFWSENGELVCISTEDYFYVLRYMPENLSREESPEDGYENAFEFVADVPERVKTGLWVGDCFVYTNGVDRLNYFVGGEIVTIAHLEKTMYLLGYLAKENRVYLGDKELNVVSYSLLLSVLNYQTAVMREDFEAADKILPDIPNEQRTRVAQFLEKQNFKVQALAVSTDPDHRFDLAIGLGNLEAAFKLAEDDEGNKERWKQVAELAVNDGNFELAKKCLTKAKDFPGLLLLATAGGEKSEIKELADSSAAAGFTNISFLSNFLTGDLDSALDTLIISKRFTEAAFMARCYRPERTSEMVQLWKEEVKKRNVPLSTAIADPSQYPNLFPDMDDQTDE